MHTAHSNAHAERFVRSIKESYLEQTRHFGAVQAKMAGGHHTNACAGAEAVV